MGSLIKRNNGIYYGVFCHSGKRVWRSTGSTNLVEAESAYASLQKEFVSWDRLTISTFKALLLELTSGELAPTTCALYSQTLYKFCSIVGDIHLKAVKPYHVELFKSKRLKEVSPTKVNIDFRTLRAAFNRGHLMGMIDTNPFSKCRNIRVLEKEPEFITLAQFKRLMELAGTDQLSQIILVAITTGLRAGELVNLRWSDIDFSDGFIRLRNNDNFVLKGKRGRSIPLNETSKRVLSRIDKESEYVFDKTKKLKNPVASVSRRFKKIARRAGIPEGIHFHSLRHSFATWMVQSKVPVPYIQKCLGHSSISTTMIYTHVEDSNMQDSVRKIDLFLQEDRQRKE